MIHSWKNEYQCIKVRRNTNVLVHWHYVQLFASGFNRAISYVVICIARESWQT